ncbi:methylated-DNA--[protein]-cysteine S-methyltransferase [Aquibacillus albus]|uniref:O-6-methylguanine DNA methyltransferase n=1 Tax=Aquibacillus albus TaxID=1168171 RepID=A0ABS2N0F9_9BACI|nr:methylated-DNA--[protein]-cysteine S-methyltransferase [Aquibacillus albus]MBM7571631.1 O-6-methylguanine DNA methyltransferase [Aquibacillus albus]
MGFLYYDEVETAIGPITMIKSNQGLCRVDFGSMNEVFPVVQTWADRFSIGSKFMKDESLLKEEKQQLMEYFSGNRKMFTTELHLVGTPFQQKVWQALIDQVPHGETKSYKNIAESIQKPKAVRAVGGAVNKNPIVILVPCHRIIGSDGSLVGYNGGLERKQQLLHLEHAPVVNKKR